MPDPGAAGPTGAGTDPVQITTNPDPASAAAAKASALTPPSLVVKKVVKKDNTHSHQ